MQHAVHHNFVVMETEKTLFFILKPFWFVKCSETIITSDLTVIVRSGRDWFQRHHYEVAVQAESETDGD